MTRYQNETEDYRQGVKDRTRIARLNNPQRYLWLKARRRAIRLGLPFEIEPGDIRIPAHCPALGIYIEVLSKHHDHSATLDQLVIGKGYVKGNIAVISRRANRIKNNATAEELRKIAQWLLIMGVK
jgi:hypothetical protein